MTEQYTADQALREAGYEVTTVQLGKEGTGVAIAFAEAARLLARAVTKQREAAELIQRDMQRVTEGGMYRGSTFVGSSTVREFEQTFGAIEVARTMLHATGGAYTAATQQEGTRA